MIVSPLRNRYTVCVCLCLIPGESFTVEMIEEAGKTQVVETQTSKDKPSSAHAAMKTSPYLYNRWYKLMLKH